jgi:hypothetical protein
MFLLFVKNNAFGIKENSGEERGTFWLLVLSPMVRW